MNDIQTYNANGQGLLPFIQHEVDAIKIDQRANDGYIDATAICHASGKEWSDYRRLKNTQDFLDELSSVLKIPRTGLIQTIQGGPPEMQGTWVHPQVAINLAQWASPKFAVLVSQWVFEWMTGKVREVYRLPYHIRRYLVNRAKIPATHFSMLDELTLRLVAPLEEYGYILPTNLMPDISMGKMFSKWCRDNGYDPTTFPTYQHEFDDGKRPAVEARLYPNELLTSFRQYFTDVWLRDRAYDYFTQRDTAILPHLKRYLSSLPSPDGVADKLDVD